MEHIAGALNNRDDVYTALCLAVVRKGYHAAIHLDQAGDQVDRAVGCGVTNSALALGEGVDAEPSGSVPVL